MITYKAVKGAIYDNNGKQIAVVVPANCSKKVANQIAAYAAQQLTHDARRKAPVIKIVEMNQ